MQKERNAINGTGYSFEARIGTVEATTLAKQKQISKLVAINKGFILAPKMMYCRFKHMPTQNT